jgi:cell division protein ZapA
LTTPTVVLQIFDRDYKLACPSDQHEQLLAAARALDARMRELKSADKMLTLDRLAVLAALTFAQEALSKEQRLDALTQSVGAELKRMNEQLDGALRAA